MADVKSLRRTTRRYTHLPLLPSSLKTREGQHFLESEGRGTRTGTQQTGQDSTHLLSIESRPVCCVLVRLFLSSDSRKLCLSHVFTSLLAPSFPVHR